MTTHDHLAGVARLPAHDVLTGSVKRSLRDRLAFTRGWCWLMVALLCVSCSTAPKPDADWNSQRLWQQVATPPPTYVPTGYAANRPRSDRDGTWFTDPRDGKRLFVPKDGVPGLAPGVLEGEAKKAIGYTPPGPTAKEKAKWFAAFLLFGLGGVSVPPPD